MSRSQLSHASGLPLGFINKIEQSKAHEITVTQFVRLAMGFNHSPADFFEQVQDLEHRLRAGRDH